MSHTVIPAPATSSPFTLSNFGPVTLAQEAAAPPVTGQPGPTTTSEGTQPIGSNNQQAPAPAPFGGGMLLIFVGFFMLLILMQVFGGRKQKKQREAMLSSLARHDRVQTIGGVIATVMEVKDTEVILKVDEDTNTKVRFARSAVQQILKKAGDRTESNQVEQPEMAGA